MAEAIIGAGGKVDTGDLGGGGGAGEGGSEFLATLPEAVRDNEAFKGMENLEGLANTYAELHRTNSELQGKVPQLPESADGYEAEAVEGFTLNKERVAEFQAKAHELGLTQAQFQGLIQAELERGETVKAGLQKQRQEALDSAVNALKTEWGDKYEANVQTAENALNQLTGEEFRALLKTTGLNDNPIVVHTFHNLGTALSEDQFIGAQRRAAGGRPTGETGKPRLKFQSMET